MSEEKSKGGAPKKAGQLRNKVRRMRMQYVETELEMLQSLCEEVKIDWNTLKKIINQDVKATPTMMKAIDIRLNKFTKFIEKRDLDDVINYLDEDYVPEEQSPSGENPSETEETPRPRPRIAVFKPK